MISDWKKNIINNSIETLQISDLDDFCNLLVAFLNNDAESLLFLYKSYFTIAERFAKADCQRLLQLREFDLVVITKKYLDDFFIFLNNINRHLEIKLTLLADILRHLEYELFPSYSEFFFDLYHHYKDKTVFSNLIFLIADYINQFDKLTSCQFKEYFLNDFPFLYRDIVACYQKSKDYERALNVINKISLSSLPSKDYLLVIKTKGEIYKCLGSTKLYLKSLQDLFLGGCFENYDLLKQELSNRDFAVTYSFLMDHLKLEDGYDLTTLHQILIKELDISNLIKYYEYWSAQTISDDIEYLKIINLPLAALVYQNHILHLAKTKTNLDILIGHIKDLKNLYHYENMDRFFQDMSHIIEENKLKRIIKQISEE